MNWPFYAAIACALVTIAFCAWVILRPSKKVAEIPVEPTPVPDIHRIVIGKSRQSEDLPWIYHSVIRFGDDLQQVVGHGKDSVEALEASVKEMLS